MNRGSELKAVKATPLRARIRETTIQAILEAAEGVFADMGLHAAHMGTIAAKAGVSVGTVYNHFQDREALLAGLMAARRAELLDAIDSAIAGAKGQPLRARLRAIVAAFLGHCERHRKFVQIVLQQETGRYQQTYPQALTKKTDMMRELLERLDREMRAGLTEKALRPELAQLGGVFLMGMMRALVIRDLLLGGEGLTAHTDALIELFFAGAATK